MVILFGQFTLKSSPSLRIIYQYGSEPCKETVMCHHNDAVCSIVGARFPKDFIYHSLGNRKCNLIEFYSKIINFENPMIDYTMVTVPSLLLIYLSNALRFIIL